MDKNKYLEISNNKNLPLRCPILDRCERRAWTIYMFSYLEADSQNNMLSCLKSNNEIDEDFEEKKVKLVGESPGIMKSSGIFSFHDVCPEVNLFDNSHSISYASKTACISGDWDKLRDKEKFIPREYRHFSECPEFNKFSFENHATRNELGNVGGIIDKNELKLLVGNNLEAAIENILGILKNSSNSDLINSLILIKMKYVEVRNNEIKGVLTSDDVLRNKTQIANQLLNLIDELDKLISSK